MDSGFTTGSTLHLAALAGCALATGGTLWLLRRWRGTSREAGLLRGIGIACLVVWAMAMLVYLIDSGFGWHYSLPLQFCNLANLLGAAALLTGRRLFQSLLYFWAFALCTWAFLTPTLDSGPLTPEFWAFWLYHALIPVSVVAVLQAQQFRPGWRDWHHSVLLTLGYLGFLVLINFRFGWNYGFVGPVTPGKPTPIDFLGPYPWRVLWMALMGIVLFAVLVLPWRVRGAASRSAAGPLQAESKS